MIEARFLSSPHLIGGNAVLVRDDSCGVVLDCGFDDRSEWPPISPAEKPLDLVRTCGSVPCVPPDVPILISHGHFDHYFGLLTLPERHPVYLTDFARWNLELAYNWRVLNFSYPRIPHEIHELSDKLEFSNITVKAIPVSHSTIEARAFLVETPEGRLLYTGDFRLDGHGRTDFSKIDKVDLLLLDATNLGRKDPKVREEDVIGSVRETLEEREGIVTVYVSSTNVKRIAEIIREAHAQGREVRATPDVRRKYSYMAFKNGLPKIDHDFLHGVLSGEVLITGYFDGWYSNRVYLSIYHQLDETAGIIISHNTQIDPVQGYRKEFFRRAVTKRGASFKEVHASGHAYPKELKKIIKQLSPKRTILMHTSSAPAKRLQPYTKRFVF